MVLVDVMIDPFIWLFLIYVLLTLLMKWIARSPSLLEAFIFVAGLFGFHRTRVHRSILERYNPNKSNLLPVGFYDEFEIERVIDGDTVEITYSIFTLRIRLAEIDAPENGQPFKEESTNILRQLLEKGRVTLQVTGLDHKHGRSIGKFFVNDRDINQDMIRLGAAWHYRQYSKSKVLEQLERDAKQNKIGLWANPYPIEPWVFRNGF